MQQPAYVPDFAMDPSRTAPSGRMRPQQGRNSLCGLLIGFLLVLGLGATPALSAETRYVSDELFVSFREGPGNQYERIRFLRTGDAVELLDPPEGAEDADLDTWAYVRDEDGETGWMQGRYLMDEPAARNQLAGAEEALADAEDELARIREERDAAMAELEEALETSEIRAAELQSDLEAANARIEELEQNLEAASDGYELVETNERLRDRVQVLLERAETLEAENQQLSDRSQQEWFLAGAAVLFAGLLIGLFAPLIRRRRQGWAGGGL